MKTRLHAVILAVLGFCSNAPSSVAATYYVKAGDSGSGTSWANAMGNLQAAMDYLAALGGGHAWVAAGTYRPNSWPRCGTAAREMCFSLRSGVQVYGAFPAAGNPGMGVRDEVANPTICSGDLGVLYDYSDTVYRVFNHIGVNEDALLDGFVIEWGNANAWESPHNAGGGMRNESSSPTLIRRAFGDNRARHGVGVHNKYG